MNPVLLKPNSDTGAQVILQGRALSNMEANAYHDYKKVAMDTVMDSFQRLQQEYEAIMIEGAGSLRKSTYVRMTSPIWALPKKPMCQ
ncbi:Cobyric acid synthase [Vibrio cholerae]|nr:Cobyric acid synthase [Vibrio cholerae]